MWSWDVIFSKKKSPAYKMPSGSKFHEMLFGFIATHLKEFKSIATLECRRGGSVRYEICMVN